MDLRQDLVVLTGLLPEDLDLHGRSVGDLLAVDLEDLLAYYFRRVEFLPAVGELVLGVVGGVLRQRGFYGRAEFLQPAAGERGNVEDLLDGEELPVKLLRGLYPDVGLFPVQLVHGQVEGAADLLERLE